MIVKTILDVGEFKTWFNKISYNRILVPDTNVLMNRSLSGLGFILGMEYLKGLSVTNPRLTTLESERIANQDKRGEEANEQKRKVMLAATELFYLKESNGRFMSALDNEVLQAFSHITGQHFTDAWIRKEIQQQIRRCTFGIDASKAQRATLVTSDLINALSATAEGIDVLYITSAESDITS